MIALATEITVWLLVSSALGLIAGFALAHAFAKPAAAAPPQVITDDDEIKDLIDELRQDQHVKDEEMATLRAQLDDLRRTPEPSPEAATATTEVLETLREQVDRLRHERDDRLREAQTFKEQNSSLQKRLDETADRLVEFERQRMQGQAPRVETRPEPAAEPVAAPTPPPVVSRDPAVARERARELEQLELSVEKSSPLQVGHEAEYSTQTETLEKPLEIETTAAAAIEEPRDEAPAPESKAADVEVGHEKPIAEIAGIPSDIAERLALVGAKTTLQLLSKAGPRARRNGLATSMRLEPAKLLEYVHRADMIRVGMRDDDVTRLYAAGVRSLAGLGAAKCDALANRLQSVSTRGTGRDGAPDPHTVERWIQSAKDLPVLVEE